MYAQTSWERFNSLSPPSFLSFLSLSLSLLFSSLISFSSLSLFTPSEDATTAAEHARDVSPIGTGRAVPAPPAAFSRAARGGVGGSGPPCPRPAHPHPRAALAGCDAACWDYPQPSHPHPRPRLLHLYRHPWHHQRRRRRRRRRPVRARKRTGGVSPSLSTPPVTHRFP